MIQAIRVLFSVAVVPQIGALVKSHSITLLDEMLEKHQNVLPSLTMVSANWP
jgi:hypothetical protein